MKANGEVVFRALMQGHTVEMGGRRYRLFQRGEEVQTPSFLGETEEPWIGVECYDRDRDGKQVPNKTYLGVEMTVISLIKMAEELREDDIAIIAANLTLSDIFKKPREDVSQFHTH